MVKVENAREGDVLVFAENFDKNWIAKYSEIKIQSSEFDNRFNSFTLPKNGIYELIVYYMPQDWVNVGFAISVLTLVTVFIVLIGFKFTKW